MPRQGGSAPLKQLQYDSRDVTRYGTPDSPVVSRPMDTYSGPGKTVTVPSGDRLGWTDRAGPIIDSATQNANKLSRALTDFNSGMASYDEVKKLQNKEDKEVGYSDAMKGADAPDGASYAYMAGRSMFSGEADAIKYDTAIRDFVTKNSQVMSKEDLMKGIDDLQSQYLANDKDKFYTMGFHERGVAAKVNGYHEINAAIVNRDKIKNTESLSSTLMDDMNSVFAQKMRPEDQAKAIRDLVTITQDRGDAVGLTKGEVSQFAVKSLVTMAKEKQDPDILLAGQVADKDGIKLESLHPEAFGAARMYINTKAEQDARLARAEAREAMRDFKDSFGSNLIGQLQRNQGESNDDYTSRVAGLQEKVNDGLRNGFTMANGQKIHLSLGHAESLTHYVDKISDDSAYAQTTKPEDILKAQEMVNRGEFKGDAALAQVPYLDKNEFKRAVQASAANERAMNNSTYKLLMAQASKSSDAMIDHDIVLKSRLTTQPEVFESIKNDSKDYIKSILMDFTKNNPDGTMDLPSLNKLTNEAYEYAKAKYGQSKSNAAHGLNTETDIHGNAVDVSPTSIRGKLRALKVGDK
jgi:hypothetical protein